MRGQEGEAVGDSGERGAGEETEKEIEGEDGLFIVAVDYAPES